MNVFSFGCSLIFGTDLSDDGRNNSYPTPSQHTWPALIAQRLGYTYECRARGGIGNLMILDRVLLTSYYNPEDFYIIGWSFIDRFDYTDPAQFHNFSSNYDYRNLRPDQNSDTAKVYYGALHSEYRDKLTNLIYLKTAIDTLTSKGCRFIMTTIDDLLWCDKWHMSPTVQQLQDYVKPYVANFDGRNFLDWSRVNKFPISASGHPLEQAHAAAVDLVWPRVQALL